MVSQVVKRSRAMRMVVRSRSPASNILMIFKSAVLVEWSFLYADWRGQKDRTTFGTSVAKYRCSTTLLMMFRFDIALYLLIYLLLVVIYSPHVLTPRSGRQIRESGT